MRIRSLSHAAAITFDDGHASDYAIAAPELRARGLAAGFFITASYLGRPGYLQRAQVRELHAWSFEIGSHGLTQTAYRNGSGGWLAAGPGWALRRRLFEAIERRLGLGVRTQRRAGAFNRRLNGLLALTPSPGRGRLPAAWRGFTGKVTLTQIDLTVLI